MKILKWIGLAILVLIGVALTMPWWLPTYQRLFQTDEIRYRLTLTVDDNGRTVEGTGVLTTYWVTVLPFGIKEPLTNVRGMTSYAGEAVVVDLGEKGQIYAVITEGNRLLLPIAYGISGGAIDWSQMPQVRAMRGTQELHGHLRPKLMTFGDRMSPETAKPVDPDDLARTFGPGVALKSVTVTIVGKETPVTKGIEKWLPWLPSWGAKGLDGNRFRDARLPNQDANMFGPGSFQVPYIYRGEEK